MKVSFIIPVYKVEQYLLQCVDSIISQSYTDFEVILVDDGSPDNSGIICDECAQKDNRVRVIHKENGGLSDARNVGLELAQGEWVIFIDSDDFWVGNDCLMHLMNVVDKNSSCGFVGFNCSYYYEKKHSFSKWVAYDNLLTTPIDKNSAMHSLVASGTMPMSACLKVISRRVLNNIDLKFQKGLLSEDIPWFIDLLEGCSQCMFVNEYVYAYRQNREGSITNSLGERSFNSLFIILKQELKKIETRSFSDEAKNDLRSFLAYEFCILLSMISSLPKHLRAKKRKELSMYKWLLDFTTNPKVRKVAFVNKFLGIRLTEWILAFYLHKVRK